MTKKAKAIIRNIAEEPWQQYPGHFGGALSKALVAPETTASTLIDYRISTYEPMAYVELHEHQVQEQVYHILEGQGLMQIGDEKTLVGKHDVIFIPPLIKHGLENTGLGNLTFLVVTTPTTDE